MKMLSRLLVLALFLLAFGAPASAAVHITATLTNIVAGGGAETGPCPTPYNFTGTINASGWGAGASRVITYRFERSDGTKEKTHQWTSPAAGGSKQVVDTWSLGGTKAQWEQLHVLTPVDVLSDKSHVHPKCPGHM